ncbi:MAG TPA: DUF4349 domain-containing protein [Pyrinomonadaceae bacterium]|nr:DUF4349 domain-containing protein [Pyrinomonadaceae bacterium]
MIRAISLLVLTTVFLGSCASAEHTSKDSLRSASEHATVQAAAPTDASEGQALGSAFSSAANNAARPPEPTEVPLNLDRKVIRNADLFIEAEVPEDTQQQIAAIAQKAGGFVVESHQESSDVKVNARDVATMAVRVPADKFTEALDSIRAAAGRVITQTVKGEDVTEEFIDIEARIRAKRALEQQFIEILKRTNSVPEAMNVQSQIAQVRADIEKIEGRKRFLENQSSLSTIKIRIQTPAAISANSTGFAYRLRESFSGGLEFAMTFVLGLVSVVVAVLPFAVLIGLPGYLMIRYFWKKHAAPKSVMEIAKDEI